MVRSSIACARCRRSKVKCVNNGTNSTCKACAASSRECTYPPAATTSTPKRSEAPGNIKIEGEVESKKRVRKAEEPGRRNSQRAGDDPLKNPILTRKVWDEIYAIFKQHFSTEMPFLHPPAFRLLMRQAAMPRDPSHQPGVNWHEEKILLLGVLTLTARFHSELVSYHSPGGTSNNKSEPLAASNYYAAALASAIAGPSGKEMTSSSLERIQALLMFGLYEWSQSKGMNAWVYVGLALRLAQAIGLQYEDEPTKDSMPIGIQHMAGTHRRVPTKAVTTQDKEVRRRTFWSCFVMDRMLSSGRSRPSMILSDAIRVQLPCTDEQFLFNTSVQTGFLNQELQNSSTVDDNAALSRYCRLVEIWNNISMWSYAGGRRTEDFPPWDDSSSFYKLDCQLEGFYESLPENLTATPGKLSAHLEKQYGASTYASLHVLYLLCCITLHREYIPFIPLRCEEPVGPLDEPLFPENRYNIPQGFWKGSAEKLFKSARSLVEIVTTCQDHNALPESPLFIYAVWQAAYVNVYAKHFDQMDLGKHMQQNTATFLGLLKSLAEKSIMAKGYIPKLLYMHKYYVDIKLEYERFNQRPNWTGGGLEKYKEFERELKEFGTLENYEILSDGSDAIDQNHSRASTVAPTPNTNGDQMQGVEATAARPAANWAPINASNAPVELDARSRPMSQGPYSHNSTNYQPSSNTPSLVSPSNGDSTSSLSSPYANGQLPKYGSPLQRQSQYPPAPLPQQVMPPPSTWSPGERNEARFDNWIVPLENTPLYYSNLDDFQQSGPIFHMPGALLAAEVYSDQGVNRWN